MVYVFMCVVWCVMCAAHVCGMVYIHVFMCVVCVCCLFLCVCVCVCVFVLCGMVWYAAWSGVW